jgi:hypothetical protein
VAEAERIQVAQVELAVPVVVALAQLVTEPQELLIQVVVVVELFIIIQAVLAVQE